MKFNEDYTGVITSRHKYERLRDSIHVQRALLLIKEKRFHGKSTIDDNLRAVSEDTLKLIHTFIISEILNCGLDNYSEMAIDSTSLKANAAAPVDRNNLIRRLQSAFEMGQKLSVLGFNKFNRWHLPKWIE